MKVHQAKEIAREWVTQEGSQTPGFHGAFLHGSINWLPDEASLPTTSDVDVMIVLTGAIPPVSPGKRIYRDVLLEASYIAWESMQTAAQILSVSYLAGDFRVPGILADPSGQLTQLQMAVAPEYARQPWVYRRCAFVHDKILNYLSHIPHAEHFHDQVTAWLFATGLTTHILLVAGLQNPTVRRRYMAVRELLARHARLDFHETLLQWLGCAGMSQVRAWHHLQALTAVFDATKTVVKSPFFFASDISDEARPIAIDGSRHLIEAGYPREAIFWMVATYSRCQKILYHDAPPEMQAQFLSAYQALLADLSIHSPGDLQQRGEQLKESLPQVWEMAEFLIAENPEIVA